MTLDRNALMDRICEEIAQGKALKDILTQDGMPGRSTVYQWFRDEEFADMYARAREERAELFADEIIKIADEAKNEDAQIVRLRVDARKWAAAKLNPKRYSDKVVNEHSGPDGSPIAFTGFDIRFI